MTWLLAVGGVMPSTAQQLLSLDSCRAMALRNNKQVGADRLKQQVAENLRRSARTKYLPHVSALGTYQWTSEELSLLNDEQKSSLANLGNSAAAPLQGLGSGIQTQVGQFGQLLGQMGMPLDAFQQMAGQLQQQMGQTLTGVTGLLNTEGQKIVDAFRTDTRNIFAGSIIVTQPLFMGGAITALNRLADLNEQLADNRAEAGRQGVVYATDKAYWQVVSLKHKKELAESFLAVVRKLDDDVQKMIREGVATRSEGLSVSVKVSEAEMAVQQVDDGLTLSRMLLCQMIGLPMDAQITLTDEPQESLAAPSQESLAAPSQESLAAPSQESLAAPSSYVALPTQPDIAQALARRPELKMLENAVDMTRQTTNMLRAANLPQLALTGGYAISNPNVLNGFEKKFGGFWNIGVLLRIPIWNWGDNMYKIRAAKGATAIADLELADAREKIELQVSQSSFHVGEAQKRLSMAQANISKADENLRTANVGFSEGVINATTVMEAQTAWLQARSQLIDAEIAVRLAQTDLQKALGALAVEN